MAQKKVILAAGYVRDILFASSEAEELYLYTLQHRCIEHEILDKLQRDDGSVILRIVQQYNNSPLIKLYG